MKRFFGARKSLAVVVFALTSSASAQTVAGLRLYEQNCATCQGNPSRPRHAPDGTLLRKLSAEAVYQAPHNSANCPKELGPDFDFGSSPILRTLPDGGRILIAGQKPEWSGRTMSITEVRSCGRRSSSTSWRSA
jgi:hypothetical protein